MPARDTALFESGNARSTAFVSHVRDRAIALLYNLCLVGPVRCFYLRARTRRCVFLFFNVRARAVVFHMFAIATWQVYLLYYNLRSPQNLGKAHDVRARAIQLLFTCLRSHHGKFIEVPVVV